MTAQRTVPRREPQADVSRPWWLGVAVGVVAGVIGFGPWLVTGARLPLQNLWTEQALPEDMPWVLLPINQYYLFSLIALLAVGGLLAGFGGRLIGAQRWAPPVGLLVVHTIAGVQSLSTVSLGLDENDPRALFYQSAMTTTVVVGVALALLICWLALRPGKASRTVAIGLAALPFGEWVIRWLWTGSGPTGIGAALSSWLPWLLGAGVGIALGWCGWDGARRILAWVINAMALWVGSALIMAVQIVAGSRVLLSRGADAVIAWFQYFTTGLGPAGQGWWMALLAIVVGLATGLVRRAMARRPAADTVAD